MSVALPITDTITTGLALMYLDPSTETLKEIQSNVYLAVYPYESTIRRFYLCGDLIYLQTNLTVTITLDSLHTSDYTIQVLLGSNNPRRSDFSNAINTASILSSNLSNTNFNNAIAVDILLTSNLRTESTAALAININAVDATLAPPPIIPGV